MMEIQRDSEIEDSKLADWTSKVGSLCNDIVRDVAACSKQFGGCGKQIPPEFRLKCRVLIWAAICWQIFSIYSPQKIRCDMNEVVTESDLTIFVCPCGSQFGEELNFYFHIRQVHRNPIFSVLSDMQGKNPAKPHAYPVDRGLDQYGAKVVNTYLPLLGSEGTVLARLRKLFMFKHELPRVMPKYVKNSNQPKINGCKNRLPKWQELKKQQMLLQSSTS